NNGSRKFFPKNKIIYQEGEYENGIYLLQKGLVHVSTKTAKGTDLLLTYILPQNILGVEVLDELNHNTTARTTDDSILYFIKTETVLDLMNQNKNVEKLILKSITNTMNILAFKIYEHKFSA